MNMQGDSIGWIKTIRLLCVLLGSLGMSNAAFGAMSAPTLYLNGTESESVFKTTYGTANDLYNLKVDTSSIYSFSLTDYAWPDAFDTIALLVVNTENTSDLAGGFLEADNSGGTWDYYSSRPHSWGSDQKSLEIEMYLEAGTDYIMTVFAEFQNGCNCGYSSGYGLYSVGVTAVPLPASIVFLLSGLGGFSLLRLKARRAIA